MDRNLHYTLGIDVGGTKIAFGLFDPEHKLLARERVDTRKDCDAATLFDDIARIALAMPEKLGLDLANLDGVGLGFPSYIDIPSGHILLTSAIAALEDVPAQKMLEARFPCPVRIGNDAHCAALAEHSFGAGKGFDNMLYIPFSTGIGSAIILDGSLRRGSFGSAGESGHAIATPGEGMLCGCGNMGCYMSYLSGQGITRFIRKWISEGRETSMLELAGGDPEKIDGRVLEKAYLAGDLLAQEAVAQMIHYMGVWLFNLFTTFNVNLFVFGGGLVKMGDWYFERLRAEFEKYLRAKPRGEIYFKFAELGDDFGILGAEQLLYM